MSGQNEWPRSRREVPTKKWLAVGTLPAAGRERREAQLTDEPSKRGSPPANQNLGPFLWGDRTLARRHR